jgi:ATP-dependent RNA helicase RhlE
LNGFRNGRFEVLVATDIAARGLDIAEVSHVVNYDVPQHPEDYIHRIGRTGRMETKGDAFTLMVAEDGRHVQAIERFIAQKIPRIKLENFEYRYTALFRRKPNQALPRQVQCGLAAHGCEAAISTDPLAGGGNLD